MEDSLPRIFLTYSENFKCCRVTKTVLPSPDLIDVVKDQLYGADYVEEEDPRKYVSQKTNRGPLGDNWIAEYSEICKVRGCISCLIF